MELGTNHPDRYALALKNKYLFCVYIVVFSNACRMQKVIIHILKNQVLNIADAMAKRGQDKDTKDTPYSVFPFKCPL